MSCMDNLYNTAEVKIVTGLTFHLHTNGGTNHDNITGELSGSIWRLTVNTHRPHHY